MKIALLKARADVPAIYKLIDVCSWNDGYGHAALLFDDGTALSSHVRGGVAIRPLEYPPEDWTFFDVGNRWAEASIRDWACGELGCKYDFAGVLRFVFPLIRPSRTRWFCSEIVVAALQQVGFFWDEQASSYSPNGLYTRCVRYGFPPVLNP